jgi:AraC-like DNA-binding protein
MDSFQIIHPSPLLAPFVKHYWFMRIGEASGGERVVPTGSVSLVFHRGHRLFSATGGAFQPSAFLSGQAAGYADLVQTGSVDMISVIFRPHGARAFFALPMNECYDAAISAEDMNDTGLAELQDRLFYAPDNAASTRLIEAFLLKRLRVAKVWNFERLSAVLSAIDGGQSNRTALASTACLSNRQFQRVFAEYVGANPKNFLRIVRFQRALHTLQTHPETSLAELAFTGGFYDSSHLIKEFRTFSGYTPAEYLAACAPYSDYFSP